MSHLQRYYPVRDFRVDVMRKFTVEVEDNFRALIVHRDFVENTTSNRVVYAGSYPSILWETWGQENVTPFQPQVPPPDAPFSTLT
jgi:hypothetical protein